MNSKNIFQKNTSKKQIILLSFLAIFFTLLFAQISPVSFALATETASEIKDKISGQDSKIKDLEAAIAKSQKKVSQYAGQSASLKKEIANLNYLNSQLQKVIYKKENEIKNLAGTILEISDKISENNSEIEKLKINLRRNIFSINQISNTSLFETMLSGKPLSDVADDVSRIERVQKVFAETLKKFTSISQKLRSDKKEKEMQNEKLDDEKDELSDKKALLDKNKKDKDYLLKVTKNKETNFKKILSEQKKSKAQFEKQLLELESKLKFVLSAKDKKLKKNGVGMFG